MWKERMIKRYERRRRKEKDKWEQRSSGARLFIHSSISHVQRLIQHSPDLDGTCSKNVTSVLQFGKLITPISRVLRIQSFNNLSTTM